MKELMAKISERNRRFRTKEQIADDVAYILNSPVSYGTKFAVLAEITWVWTEFFGKYTGCPYWSGQALMLPSKGLEKACTHEHVVPKQVVIDRLFALQAPTASDVYNLLDTFLIGCIVTTEEDKKLNAAGYNHKMPTEFYDPAHPGYNNPWLRYINCGIAWQKVDDELSASEMTIAGSMATFSRIWDTPEEDAAWKYLEDL